MVLTALSALRSFHLPVKVDVSQITNPSSSTDFGSWKKWIGPFWSDLYRFRGVSSVSTPQWSDSHFTLKAGPTSGPAILRSLVDLGNLPVSLIDHLKVLGGQEFSLSIDRLLEGLPTLRELELDLILARGGEVGCFRKITGIPDLEGKTRVIAILDYWSQDVLAPLHHLLFRILRRIPQDMTFTQGSFKDHVSQWGRVKLFSIDLSSATDRFPIDLIADVLQGSLPADYVKS